MEKKDKKIFALRVFLWSLFSCIIPVCFIGWRYSLFSKVGKIQLSGWGLIAIIIVFVFVYVLTKYIRAGFVEWSMLKQVIDGVIKIVIPLGALLAICLGLRNSLDCFIQSLSCVILSEVVAIPLNPFPEWVWNKSKGRFEGIIDFVASSFYDKKNNSGGDK
jgi:hypothetical protein